MSTFSEPPSTLLKPFNPPKEAKEVKAANLGALERLPAEMIHEILDRFSIKAAVSFSQTNRAARNFITGKPMYQRLTDDYAYDFLLASLEMGTAGEVLAAVVYNALTTGNCVHCGKEAEGVYLVTGERMCGLYVGGPLDIFNGNKVQCIDLQNLVGVEHLVQRGGIELSTIKREIPVFKPALRSWPFSFHWLVGPEEGLFTTKGHAQKLITKLGLGDLYPGHPPCLPFSGELDPDFDPRGAVIPISVYDPQYGWPRYREGW